MRAEMDCPSSGYWTMGTLHVCGVRREEVTAWTSGDVRGRGYLGRVRLSGVGQAPGDKSLLPGSSPRWKGPWEIKGRGVLHSPILKDPRAQTCGLDWPPGALGSTAEQEQGSSDRLGEEAEIMCQFLSSSSTKEVVMVMSSDGQLHPPWMPCRHPPSFGGWTLHRGLLGGVLETLRGPGLLGQVL